MQMFYLSCVRRVCGLMLLLGMSVTFSAWSNEPPDVTSYLQYRLTLPEKAPDYGSLRRLKLMVQGELRGGTSYYLQGLYKDNNRSTTDGQPYLQEAWLKCQHGNRAITVGQFKPPFGLERFTPDWDLDTIDRSIATDSLIPNGKLDDGKGFARDRGVQWEMLTAEKQIWWAVGVFDGHGANANPKGVAPLVVTRIRWMARNKKTMRVKVGGAFATREASDMDFSKALPGTAALGYAAFDGRDTRWNLETALDWSAWRFRGEYFHAHFAPDNGTMQDVTAMGFYAQVCRPFARRLEAALKYEEFDPNASIADRNDLCQTTLGLNCFLRGRQDKVQVNYVWKRERVQPVDNDALVIQVQKFF